MGSRSGSGGAAGGRARLGGAWSTAEGFARGAYDAAEAAATKWPDREGYQANADGSGATPSGSYRPALFGSNKVFIDHAHAMARTQGYKGSLDDFKGELLVAQRAGHISLARADLVEAMHPLSVERSAIYRLKSGDGQAAHHFIVLKRTPRA
jgi:hypothetical protein